jgi:enterochelin esterase-like enzyme
MLVVMSSIVFAKPASDTSEGTSSAAGAANLRSYSQAEIDALEKTTVYRSAESPTGYYVTFRYKDPNASRVRVYGEWMFSDIADATIVTSTNAGPAQWKDGYTVWQTTGWPTADMTLNRATGVWSYTIPLPNGTWDYRFYVGGDPAAKVTDYTGAVMAYDPNNKPYMAHDPAANNGEQHLTSVFVPWDPVKQAKSARVDEQAPRPGQNGRVSFEKAVLSGGKETYYGIYLPYNFDVNRAEKYPLLVLFHGGGGYEASWLNNGLVNILDNMIAEGRMEPAIVVTPCGSDFPDPRYSWDRPALMDYVVGYILPRMAQNYNASSDPARRALAGLSQGGAAIMRGYFNNTESFGYYFCMSAPMRGNVEADFTKPALKNVKLLITMGLYDHVITRAFYNAQVGAQETSTYDYIWGLGQAGVPFKVMMSLPYGHQWTLWRENMVYAIDTFLWK